MTLGSTLWSKHYPKVAVERFGKMGVLDLLPTFQMYISAGSEHTHFSKECGNFRKLVEVSTLQVNISKWCRSCASAGEQLSLYRILEDELVWMNHILRSLKDVEEVVEDLRSSKSVEMHIVVDSLNLAEKKAKEIFMDFDENSVLYPLLDGIAEHFRAAEKLIVSFLQSKKGRADFLKNIG